MTIERLELLRQWLEELKTHDNQQEHRQFLEESIEALVQAEDIVQKSCEVCGGLGCPVCVPDPVDADAFLFTCVRPGRRTVFASIGAEGVEGYPFSEWDTVDRQRLIAVGPKKSMYKKGS